MSIIQLPEPIGSRLAPIDEMRVSAVSADDGERASSDQHQPSHHLLHARYDFWIQTLKNHSPGLSEGVYVSTFQKGRGQHVTSLTTRQARELGERLVSLADEIDLEVMRDSWNRRHVDGGSG